MSIYTGGSKSKYQDPPEDATTQQVFSFGDANVISDLIEALQSVTINRTYQLGSGGGTENYTVLSTDSGTYFKSVNTNNHTVRFEPTSLNNDLDWIVINSNADGGTVQITRDSAVTFNVKGIGEQNPSILTIEEGGAVFIKKNSANNYDVIGDIVIP